MVLWELKYRFNRINEEKWQKKFIMLLFCLEIKLFITHKPGKWYCSEFAVSLLRRPNNPTSTFLTYKSCLLSAFSLFIWSLMNLLKYLTFDHRLWFLGKPECSLRHCWFYLNLQKRVFSQQKHLRRRRLCVFEKLHLTEISKDLICYFSFLLNFYIQRVKKKKKKLYVCDKLNLNLNINTRTWLKIFISQFYYKSL